MNYWKQGKNSRFTLKNRSIRISRIQSEPVTLACERLFRVIDAIIKSQKQTGTRLFYHINHDSGTAFTQLATGKEAKNWQEAGFSDVFGLLTNPTIFFGNNDETTEAFKINPIKTQALFFQIYFEKPKLPY